MLRFAVRLAPFYAPGPSEGDIQTAIALTEQVRPPTAKPPTETPDLTPTETLVPLPTHTATIAPPAVIELQVKSELVKFLDYEIWVIEWGINGSVSFEVYDWGI